MISCNNAESMQIRERCALADGEETWTPDVESWCAEIELIRNCLDYITHLSPILFRYSIVLVL